MSCPQCQGIEQLFDKGLAAGELETYRKKGPARQTRLLLETIRQLGVDGRSLLDIGGGVGAIQHELFKSGARSVVNVDASSAYLAAAQEEAARLGYTNQARYLHGDFVQLADTVETVDIVTLDRVICCYPDMHTLVNLSSAHAGKIYALVFPRDVWWMRIGGRLLNLVMWIQRSGFRFFVHPFAEVDALVRSHGLQPHLRRNMGMWQVVLYARA